VSDSGVPDCFQFKAFLLSLTLLRASISSSMIRTMFFSGKDKTGTIVGQSSIYVNCARVLLDGNKSPTTVHRDYLEAILSVIAE
jgi:hypothetical protein